MPSFFRRHWFLFGIATVAVLGFTMPGPGTALRASGWVLPLMTATSLFLSAVGLDISGLRSGADLRGIVVGVSSTYIVAPLLAVVLVHVLGPAPAGPGSEGAYFFEAMMIVAAQAGTIASAPALTLVAGGNQALALLTTLSTNATTSIVTPLILRASVGTVVSFPLGRMISEDAMVVLLPVVIAQIVHRLAWQRLKVWKTTIVQAAQAIILVFVYTGIAAAAAHLSQRPALILAFVAVAASLHVALLAWNFAVSTGLGLAPADRTAVVLCGSQKTLPNGIYLWDTFFSSNPHGALALVCFHVFQLVLDSLLVPWLAPGPAAEEARGPDGEPETDGA